MNRLYINQAAETPEVLFEPEQGTLRFKGNSHPEDARAFYDPIRNIIATYLETKNERELRVDFILDILTLLLQNLFVKSS